MRKTTRPDGAEIAWYDEGSHIEGRGTAVLLIMGLAYPAAAWFRQVPVLARQHRVLTVDNRGTGGTGLAPGAPYTVETMAADCLAVLGDAGVEQAHVVGISMGGLMAQELALSHPERLLSLTLMSSHPGTVAGVWPQEMQEFMAARLGMPAEERGEFSIPFNYHPTTSREQIEEDWRAREAGTAGPEGYAAQGGTASWSRLDELPSVTTRTLVVVGAQDRLVVPANSEILAEAIPDAKLVLIDEANHILTTDRAEEVNSLLLSWFAEVDEGMSRLRAVRSDGVGALAERVLADLDGLVERMGEAYREEIPEYAALSPGQFAVDVLPVSRRLVTTFLACVVEGRSPTQRELAPFEQSGRQRLAMGMPLESVLHAYRIAGREAWAAMCAAVDVGETAVLADLGTRWLDIVDRTSSLLAQAYLAASHERLRHVDARRRELVEALLSATDPSEVAAVSLRFSTVLAAQYVPVLVSGTAAASGIDALLAEAPPGTLGGHRGDRVLLLVPTRTEPPRPRPAVLTCWGRPAACGPALLDEVHQVERLLLTALAEGHAEGVLGPDDLLVEQLLLGNERVAGALRRRVLDVLSGRDPGGVVTATLRTYLETGSVPETARRELVHANTVGYRLGRVRELTGLDPRVPREAALLVLGLGLPQEEST